jgi:F-type H+-transporting ATPase subunit a
MSEKIQKTKTDSKEEHTPASPHISIKAEPLFHIGIFPVTNSLITSVIVTILFFVLAGYYASQFTKKHKSTFFYAFHSLLKAVYGIFESVLRDKTQIFFPLLGAFFLFILLNNWLGLVPGVGSILVPVEEHGEVHKVPLFRGGTADLNTTIALAIISVVVTQIIGLKFIGWKAHLSKYFTIKSPIDAIVGLFEVVSEFSRILSFSFRLFGNVLAGEVLLSILAFLLPIVLSFVVAPMFFMEIFVGFIQAFVFSMLTAVFISMAVAKHH